MQSQFTYIKRNCPLPGIVNWISKRTIGSCRQTSWIIFWLLQKLNHDLKRRFDNNFRIDPTLSYAHGSCMPLWKINETIRSVPLHQVINKALRTFLPDSLVIIYATGVIRNDDSNRLKAGVSLQTGGKLQADVFRQESVNVLGTGKQDAGVSNLQGLILLFTSTDVCQAGQKHILLEGIFLPISNAELAVPLRPHRSQASQNRRFHWHQHQLETAPPTPSPPLNYWMLFQRSWTRKHHCHT